VPVKDRKDGEKEDYLVRGNITDQGVLNFFKQTMGEEPIIAYIDEIKAEGKTLLKIPFSSSRKKQTIVVHQPDQEGTDKEVRVYTKGGPDFMLRDGLVKRMLCEDGSIADLTDAPSKWPKELQEGALFQERGETHEDMLQCTIKLFASKAYRTILTTYRDMSMAEFEAIKDDDTGYDSAEAHHAIE
jgi:magnesium-transporting ATPase (P-type)